MLFCKQVFLSGVMTMFLICVFQLDYFNIGLTRNLKNIQTMNGNDFQPLKTLFAMSLMKQSQQGSY